MRTKPRPSWPRRNGWPPRPPSTWPSRGRLSSPRTKAQDPVQRTITIGNAGTKGLRTYVQLFAVIAAANDVKVDVASNSTFVYAYGFAEDIDASHALYASLVMQMVRASESYLASGKHRPTPTITARLNFQLAFGARIGRRLARRARRGDPRGPDQADSSIREPQSRCATRKSSCSTFTAGSPKRAGTWQAHRASAGYSSAARRAGDRAGRRARLGNSPELPNGRTPLER